MLDHNNLGRLPERLGSLPALRVLSFCGNQVSDIPPVRPHPPARAERGRRRAGERAGRVILCGRAGCHVPAVTGLAAHHVPWSRGSLHEHVVRGSVLRQPRQGTVARAMLPATRPSPSDRS